MKKILLTLAFISSGYFMYAQVGEWTWMSGTSSPNTTGSFGTQGVPSPNNHPPALYEAAHWTDSQGNFWLFGGATLTGLQQWSDLWKYDPVTNEWTWMKGPGIQGQPGIYGTLGIPAASNRPGSRGWGLISWTDTNNDFWLYGGYGTDAFGSAGDLGDLWKYSVATNEWTWMNGSNMTGAIPVTGTYQTFSPSAYPGVMEESTAGWVDADGNLWFFGAYGSNIVWEYDVSINQWAWMNGTPSFVPATYGTKGIFASNNQPGSRNAYCTWVDHNNKFWLFGGNLSGNWADLWEFDPDLKQWAWMSGSNVSGYTGNAGPLCDTSTNYTPTSRRENTVIWTDSCDNAWMFGGYNDITGYFLNDVWTLSTSQLSWAWADGAINMVLLPVYGTKGVSAPTNDPGGRMGSPYWKDSDGNFWLYGGWGGITTTFIYADLWRYKPDPGCAGFNGCSSSLSGIGTSSQEVCQKFCIDFEDQTGGNPTAWQWTFPGGSPSSSTQQDPTNICYNNPGVFDVTLITTSTNGNDTLTLSDFITVYPTPAIPTIMQTGYTLTSSVAANYQWQFNSVNIPGATNQSYVVTQTGYYTIVTTDQNGCSVSATTYVLITGIENVLGDENILIYPNPSNGNFIIECLNCATTDEMEILIYNTLGQLIFSSKEKINPARNKTEINLCDKDESPCVSATGVYFIEIKTIDHFARKKIIIEK